MQSFTLQSLDFLKVPFQTAILQQLDKQTNEVPVLLCIFYAALAQCLQARYSPKTGVLLLLLLAFFFFNVARMIKNV